MDFINKLANLEQYCPNNNNWILLTNFRQIIDHSKRTVQKIENDRQVAISNHNIFKGADLRHIFFNYMTEDRLTALVLLVGADVGVGFDIDVGIKVDIDVGVKVDIDVDESLSPLPIMKTEKSKNKVTQGEEVAPPLLKGQQQYIVLIDNIGEVEIVETEGVDAPPLLSGQQHLGLENTVKEELELQISNFRQLPVIKSVQSTITILSKVEDLVNRDLLPKKYQQMIGIYQWSKKNLDHPVTKFSDSNGGNNNLPFYLNLAGQLNENKRLTMIDRWIRTSGFKLDFSLNYSITSVELLKLSHSQSYNVVKHIIFDQNCQLTDFAFLGNFKELKIIEIIQCQQINNDLLKSICQYAPQTEALILKNNVLTDLRIVLPILKLTKLRLLKIDYENMLCSGRSAKEELISQEEWKCCHCFNLEQLELNSDYLTLDVLDYLIKACPKLHTIVLGEKALKDVSQNALFDEKNNREEDKLNFHLMGEMKKGIKASKPIRFKNMQKDLISAPFSKAMLAKIRQNDRTTLVEAGFD